MRGDLAIGLVLAPAFGERGSFVPLGLAYLNGALRRAGFAPAYFDVGRWVRNEEPDLYARLSAVGFSPDEGGFFGPQLDLLLQIGRPELFDDAPLARAIERSARARAARLPALDVALLTLWDSNLYYAAALGRILRERGTKVAMGGPGASLPQVRHLLVRLGAADWVMQGEGEERVVELARALAGGDAAWWPRGATVRGPRGEPVDTPPAGPLRIHDLPRPDFEGFDLDGWVPLISSRGCIRDCSFCTERAFWRRYRLRRVEEVLDEMEAAMARYGVRRFEFNDDLLNGNPRWLRRLCEGIVERGWDVRWICFMEPYRLDGDLLDLVARAGCTLIKFGVQHFDRSMLRLMGRGDEVEDVVGVLHGSVERGMRVDFDVIPGHPGETEEHHAVNLRRLPEVLDGRDGLRANVNPFLLLYGSRVHADPARYGVHIEVWGPERFPPPVRKEFGYLAPRFIRGYTQHPPRGVVAERTRQLEDVVRRASARHVLPVVDVGPDGRVDARPAGHRAGVVLRPTPTCTPRALLAAIAGARGADAPVVAAETAGPPFDRQGFVGRARASGLDVALVAVRGDPAAFRFDGAALRRGRLAWLLHLRPPPGELGRLSGWVEVARRQGALGVYAELRSALDDGACLDEVAEAVRGAVRAARARSGGKGRGVRFVCWGLPMCAAPEVAGHVLSAPLLAERAWSSELVQRPRCRSCRLSPRCPGAPRGLLEREGEQVLRPQGGRPVDDDARLEEDWRALLAS